MELSRRGFIAAAGAAAAVPAIASAQQAAKPAPKAGQLNEEMLGNLLENAAKYGTRRVHVMARRDGAAFRLEVSDDGPWFPDQPERLLERGVRADMLTPGQGIGLAAVAELVEAYRGTIRLLRSTALGGARVEITWQA